MILEERIQVWIHEIDKDELWDNSFIEIVDFFVLHSLNTKLSVREKSLSEYHWITPWRKPYWLNKQLKLQSSNYNLLFSTSNYNQLDNELIKSDLSVWPPANLTLERLCFDDINFTDMF